MPARASPATILVVDDDDVLLQVLSRVLQRDGHSLLRASSVAQALETAKRHCLDLVLLDLCLPDGDGVDLGEKLRAGHAELPMILMTAYPLRLRDYPDLTGPFARVLTKPPDLSELRGAVATALLEKPMQPLLPSPHSPSASPTIFEQPPPLAGDTANGTECASVVAVAEAPHPDRFAWVKSAAGAVIVVLILVAFLAFVTEVPWVTNLLASVKETKEQRDTPATPALPAVELVKDKPHTLLVPQDVRTTLGIRKAGVDITAVAKEPAQTRPLVLPGSTMLDPARIMRIRVRYTPADVKEIGQVRDEEESSLKGQTVFRELHTGDRVKKGDLLAVLYSTDLGQKKNDLIDALVALKLDQETLDRTVEANLKGAQPDIAVTAARRAVEGDFSLIGRAVNTMRTWNIAEEDIQAAYDEAAKISERKGKRDPEKEKLWPRAELRAPGDGVIVERNVGAPGETWVDNTQNLFQIAKVDRLLVVANCPEDDLPILHDLKKKRGRIAWTVRTVGQTSTTTVSGSVEEIGYLIDPNQHTAIVKGYIDNPGELIRAGQYISATITLPPPSDVVEIPVDALADDGKQSLVFVQDPNDKQHYTMRRVHVTHRFERSVFVRNTPLPEESRLTAAEAEEGLLPKEPLSRNDRVLQNGVGELKAALLNLESQREPQTNEAKR
jgi:cobalt-zinc-cadmium efflux system membrane fusion protein